MSKNKVFLITGVSSGFGRAFSEAVIAAGHTVVGTVRRGRDRAVFEAISPMLAHAVLLDVTDASAIQAVVPSIVSKFGQIDVLINNAGYGHEGVLEESPLEAMRHQFEVNVFGAVAMIKAVLPGMRERRSGHIINMSSMAGYAPLPGIAYYAGSKFLWRASRASWPRKLSLSASRLRQWHRDRFVLIGLVARFAANGLLATTTRCSIRSGRRAKRRAASRAATQLAPRKHC